MTRTSYRLLRMQATASASGVTVTEQWFTCTADGGEHTEVPEGEPRQLATSTGPLAEVDPDLADDELVGGGFDRVSDWTTHPDGTLTAEVDYYDPTP